MPFRVETVILSPEKDQYAGKGQEVISAERIAALAQGTEALGFDGVTTPEAGHDPYLPLALVAEHTSRIRLGTNVAIAFPRSPMVTAQIAWDLQQLSGGRFLLGLGTQVRPHVERRYAAAWSAAPGPRLRDYILCLKQMFESFQTGKRPDFQGDHYQFTLLPPFFNPGPIEHPDVPVCIAGVNHYMAQLAGELCDALRLHPIATFRFAREVVMPAIERGAKRADREASRVELIGAPFLAVGQDEAELEAAKGGLRQQIAFYASTPTYHPVLELHGWGELGSELHRLSREGRWTEMPELIDDAMLAEWAVVALQQDLAAALLERCTGLFDTVLIDLPAQLRADEPWVRETVRTLQRAT
jgi:probable F420-dependent oxidoreductase